MQALLTNIPDTVKYYEPPVKLSKDEVRRLNAYGCLLPSPVPPDNGTMPPFSPGGGSAAPGAPDTSSLGKDTVPGSGSSQHPRQDSGNGGAAFGAGGSSALQALYASVAVKQAFASLSYRDQPVLILDSDDDNDDEDDWEDRMDPIAFARYYGAQSPHLARIVQDHDDNMRERLVEGVIGWVRGIK